MGSAGSTAAAAPRAVLQTPEQVFFATGDMKKVEGTIEEWMQDGMPLGLTQETFKQALCLEPKSQVDTGAIFKMLDSDGNQKVDAFELLSAITFLAEAALEDKVQALFPVFDFSGTGKLNFDEVNILLQSVSRGLTKVCGSKAVGDEALVDACRRSFDAHNLRYDKQITREQVKRWMLNDVEVMAFLMTFHQACKLEEAMAELEEQLQFQIDVFSQETIGNESAAVHELFRSADLQQAFGGEGDDFRGLAGAIASQAGPGGVGKELFARAARAWDAFSLVDTEAAGEVAAVELRLLLWLSSGEEPAPEAVEQRRERMGLVAGDRLARSDWISACLQQQQQLPAAVRPPSTEQQQEQ